MTQPQSASPPWVEALMEAMKWGPTWIPSVVGGPLETRGLHFFISGGMATIDNIGRNVNLVIELCLKVPRLACRWLGAGHKEVVVWLQDDNGNNRLELHSSEEITRSVRLGRPLLADPTIKWETYFVWGADKLYRRKREKPLVLGGFYHPVGGVSYYMWEYDVSAGVGSNRNQVTVTNLGGSCWRRVLVPMFAMGQRARHDELFGDT